MSDNTIHTKITNDMKWIIIYNQTVTLKVIFEQILHSQILTERNQETKKIYWHEKYIKKDQSKYHPTKQLISNSALFRVHSKLFIQNHTK